MKPSKHRASLNEKERADLSAFLAMKPPKGYFDLDGLGNGKIDFHYNYEEIYDYADALLRGEEIDLGCNFLGLRAVAVNEEFCKILEVVARRNEQLGTFCDLFIRTIKIVGHFADR